MVDLSLVAARWLVNATETSVTSCGASAHLRATGVLPARRVPLDYILIKEQLNVLPVRLDASQNQDLVRAYHATLESLTQEVALEQGTVLMIPIGAEAQADVKRTHLVV